LGALLQLLVELAELLLAPVHAGELFIEAFMEVRSEEHTSELQSRGHLVCRLLLEKKKVWHLLQRRRFDLRDPEGRGADLSALAAHPPPQGPPASYVRPALLRLWKRGRSPAGPPCC